MNALSTFLARRGAMAELARGLGITHAAVRQWGERVPAERLIEVERLTGIPREALRPDLYVRDPLPPIAQQVAQAPPDRQQMGG